MSGFDLLGKKSLFFFEDKSLFFRYIISMKSKPPFLIIPWENDPIQALLEHCLSLREEGRNFHDICLIFMHDRPRRYFIDAIRNSQDIQKPCLLPNILTFQELVGLLQKHFEPRSVKKLCKLDQIALLYKAVKKCSKDNPDSELSRLPLHELEEFLPWGYYLADLMESCFFQGLEPKDIKSSEDELPRFAVALLASLRNIFAQYRKELDDNASSSTAFEHFCVSKEINKHEFEDLPQILQTKCIFVANYDLSGTEERICRYFWEKGSSICLHTDVHILSDEKMADDSAKHHAEWLKKWQAKGKKIGIPQKRETKIQFFGGYDLHSQFDALKKDFLAENGEKTCDSKIFDSAQAENAIVLGQAKALFPLLHLLHKLPKEDCNISLGYPLEQSLIMHLFELLLEIHLKVHNNKNLQSSLLLSLFRHPYLQSLQTDEEISLQNLLSATEQKLFALANEGKAFISTEELFETISYNQEASKNEKNLLLLFLDIALIKLGQSETTAMLGEAIDELCNILLKFGSHLWDKHPLDAECLYRMNNSIIKTLKDNSLAHESLSWNFLHALLVRLIQEERVPFEADPLTGTQVLGIPETRFLRLRRVFLLDLCDDVFPGKMSNNPLLPDSLHSLLGLPDSRHHERMSAYTFTRLLKSADEVFLYWQEGTQSSPLSDDKKIKSRFIEECIWQKEFENQTLYEGGKKPLRMANFHIETKNRPTEFLLKTPEIARQMLKYLEKNALSATKLQKYITCPLQFFYSELCGLKSPPSIPQGRESQNIGNLVHDMLQDALTPYIDKDFPENFDEIFFRALLNKHMLEGPLADNMPAEHLAMLKVSLPKKLASAFEKTPKDRQVHKLEYSIKKPLPYVSKNIHFYGKLDRIDKDASGHYILDYKTGTMPKLDTSIWQDGDLWEKFANYSKILENPIQVKPEMLEKDLDDLLESLGLVRARFADIQLYLYACLYEAKEPNCLKNVGYVDLHDSAKICSIVSDEEAEEMFYREKTSFFAKKLSLLFRFCLNHMISFPYFVPNKGAHCHWCFINKQCIVQ